MNMKTVMILMMMGCSMAACARQSTPSMMNPNKPQLLSETALQQMPVKSVNAGYLNSLSEEYVRYGTDVMQLSLAYDPNSKTYGAVQAFKDLSRIKSGLEMCALTGGPRNLGDRHHP